MFLLRLCYEEIATGMKKPPNEIKNNFPSEGGEQTFHVASVVMLHRMQIKCF